GRAERSGVAYTLVDPTDEVSLSRILERLPVDGRPSPWVLPEEVDVPETPPWEAKSMAKTIDFQRRKADPTYKGAFHEKKRKGGARKSSSSRRARKRR
ncbi:MAG: hypothetical protein ACPG6N_06995, partial [Flavobacteriales bacterium]